MDRPIQRKQSSKLAREALDWINSLELPAATAEPHDTSSVHYHVAEYRAKLLQRGLSMWISKHSLRLTTRLSLKAKSTICSDRMLVVRQKLAFKRWRWFVDHCYLSKAAVEYIDNKYIDNMKHRFKLRIYLLYWLARAQHRHRMKALVIRTWEMRRRGSRLLKQVEFAVRVCLRNACVEDYWICFMLMLCILSASHPLSCQCSCLCSKPAYVLIAGDSSGSIATSCSDATPFFAGKGEPSGL